MGHIEVKHQRRRRFPLCVSLQVAARSLAASSLLMGACLVIVAVALRAAAARADTAGDFLPMCETAIAARTDQRTLTPDQTADAVSCIEYVRGAFEALSTMQALSDDDLCIHFPEGVTAAQAIYVLVDRLKRWPQFHHQPPMSELLIALSEAFPCSQ
jgi:hypothetical protein